MKIVDYLSEEDVFFGIFSNEKEDILKELAKKFLNKNDVIKEGKIENFIYDLIEREKLASTAMQDGIAIPHAKSSSVNKTSLILVIDKKGKNFDSFDEEPSKLFFVIAASEECKKEHLDLLQKISKLSFEEEILEELLNADNSQKVIEILKDF